MRSRLVASLGAFVGGLALALFTGYAHMSERDVHVGDTVSQGQVIGKVGMTGLAARPHLHWEMSVSGVLVNALRWLDGSQGF